MQSPEQLGFDPQKLEQAQKILEHHVQEQTTPSAVGLILRHKGIVASWATGKQTYDSNALAIETDTIYDLASVTKAFTTTLCILFDQNGSLDLDAPSSITLLEHSDPVGGTAREELATEGAEASAGLEVRQRFQGGRAQDARGVRAQEDEALLWEVPYKGSRLSETTTFDCRI